MRKAFTLVEILIVVAVLGILAAVGLPMFQSHTTKAKESAAKSNLHMFREAIERYAAQHRGVAPGYPNGDTSQNPSNIALYAHLVAASSDDLGRCAVLGTSGYDFGPYLSTIPKNPFNGLNVVNMLADGSSFPDEATGEYGWMYKAATKTLKLDWPGTDTEGVAYYNY